MKSKLTYQVIDVGINQCGLPCSSLANDHEVIHSRDLVVARTGPIEKHFVAGVSSGLDKI